MGEVEASGQRGCPHTLSHAGRRVFLSPLKLMVISVFISLSFIQSSPPFLCEMRSQVCQFHPENDIYPLLFFCPLSSSVSRFQRVLTILGQRVSMHYSDPKPRANEDWLCNKVNVLCFNLIKYYFKLSLSKN